VKQANGDELMDDFKPETGQHKYSIPIDGKKISFIYDYKPDSEDLVVFFHGLICDKDSFIHVHNYPEFAAASLLLIDFIGFGESSRPVDFSYKMEDQAGLCERLINKLPGENIHLAAHSMGGAVALLFSSEFNRRVKSFADIEGNLIAEDCTLLSRRTIQVTPEEYEARLFDRQRRMFRKSKAMRFDKTLPLAAYRSSQSLVEWSDSGKLLEKFKSWNIRKGFFYGERSRDLPIMRRLDFVDKYEIPSAGIFTLYWRSLSSLNLSKLQNYIIVFKFRPCYHFNDLQEGGCFLLIKIRRENSI
jgi:pimeloyl-ACP methyl ester carboxylesterase